MFKKSSKLFSFDLPTIVIILFILSFKSFAYNPSYVPSGSMLPTIQDKSFILVDVHTYGLKIPFTKITLIPISNPQRGDIAVFRMPLKENTNYIKRIVAVPGDKIYFNQHEYFINETPKDLYKYNYTIIPEDKYFAIGDNIEHSYDSRFWGFVPKENLVGKYVTTLVKLKSVLPD